MVKSYRELRVWQAAMSLVEEVYLSTKDFPKEETFGLKSQMRRAAVSVPSNIAEGHAREHLKEYLHHISISQGSLAELETQLEIAERLGYISPEQHSQFNEHTGALGRQLYALRNSLNKYPKNRHPAPDTRHLN
jgi:four helix bundle protein